MTRLPTLLLAALLAPLAILPAGCQGHWVAQVPDEKLADLPIAARRPVLLAEHQLHTADADLDRARRSLEEAKSYARLLEQERHIAAAAVGSSLDPRIVAAKERRTAGLLLYLEHEVAHREACKRLADLRLVGTKATVLERAGLSSGLSWPAHRHEMAERIEAVRRTHHRAALARRALLTGARS
jgi:hypothetical protein